MFFGRESENIKEKGIRSPKEGDMLCRCSFWNFFLVRQICSKRQLSRPNLLNPFPIQRWSWLPDWQLGQSAKPTSGLLLLQIAQLKKIVIHIRDGKQSLPFVEQLPGRVHSRPEQVIWISATQVAVRWEGKAQFPDWRGRRWCSVRWPSAVLRFGSCAGVPHSFRCSFFTLFLIFYLIAFFFDDYFLIKF